MSSKDSTENEEEKPKVPTKEEKLDPIPHEEHDCIICPPKENCKHTVPLHETLKSLVRGNAGVEDLFKKINEVTEWIIASGLTLKPKNRSKK